ITRRAHNVVILTSTCIRDGRPDLLSETDRASGRTTLEAMAMSTRKFPSSFRSDKTVAAIVAAMTLIVVAPSVATAGTAARSVSAAQQISNRAGTMTDISAAQRRHRARRGYPA